MKKNYKGGEKNSSCSCSHPMDSFAISDGWNFFKRQNLLFAFAYYFERSKKNLLSLLALITSIIPFLKINDLFCFIIFKQSFPYSSVLKAKVFHSGVCLFFTSLTIVLLIIKIVILKILDKCFRSYSCSHFYSSF